MIAMKLGWAVLEGICVWLTLYYGSSGALALAAALLVLPLGSLPIHLFLRKRLRVRVEAPAVVREGGRGRRHDLSGKPHAAARPAYPLPGNDPESAERRALYPECHDMGVPERAAAHVPALGKRVLRTHPDLRGAGEAL